MTNINFQYYKMYVRVCDLYRNLPYMELYVLTYENLCCVIKKLWYAQNYEEIENKPVPRFIKTISGGVAGNQNK